MSKQQPPILKAVAVVKVGDLQYRVYELLIQGDKVLGKRALDRGAGDIPQIQIGRAETVLWGHTHEQAEGDLSRIKDL